MKEKQSCTAYCNEQGHILVNMFNDNQYEIHNKETALQLAQSILSAVDEAWIDEDLIIHDGDVLIAINSNGLCHDCYFFNKGCDDIKCQPHYRKDGRNVYWKLKE